MAIHPVISVSFIKVWNFIGSFVWMRDSRIFPRSADVFVPVDLLDCVSMDGSVGRSDSVLRVDVDDSVASGIVFVCIDEYVISGTGGGGVILVMLLVMAAATDFDMASTVLANFSSNFLSRAAT